MSESYGETRWLGLFAALLAPDKKVARLSPYMDTTSDFQSILSQKYVEERLAERDPEKYYVLDLASLIPPLALAPSSSDRCLDMCAAPGGKTLVLASLMALSEDAVFELVANEISPDRRSRLIRVLKEQLPDRIFRQIKITKHDASKWCLYQKEYYDKILLDAPCSGERYFVQNEREVLGWTKKRSQNMGSRQFALLASAFECLKIDGEIVYSTCSISQFENDDVVRKLLKKRDGKVEILKFDSPMGEATEFGWQILPDHAEGFGPIYFSKIRKKSI